MSFPSIFRFFQLLGSVLIGLTSALLIFRFTTGPQFYPQMVVGDLTWSGGSKMGEIPAAITFLVATPFAWIFLIQASRGYKFMRQEIEAICTLQFACLPGVIWLGQALFYPNIGIGWLCLTLLLLGWWVVIGLLFVVFLTPPTREDGSRFFEAIPLMILPVLAGFSVLGIGYGLNRTLILVKTVPFWLIGFMGAGLVLLLRSLRTARAIRNSTSDSGLSIIAGLSQIGIPMLAAGLIPTPISVQGVLQHATHLSMPLIVLVLVIASATAWDIILRVRRKNIDFLGYISPIALLLCVWILKCPFTEIPKIPTDDWHFGEALLPWILWRDFGELPFADVMPVRGFISMLQGMLGQVFFTGTASDFAHIEPLLALGLSAIVFFSFLYAVGLIPAVLAVGILDFTSPIAQIDYFFAGGVALLAGFLKRGLFLHVLIGWLVGSITFFLLAPGQGILFTATSSPLAAYAAWNSDRAGRVRALIVFALASFAMIFAVQIPILSGVLKGIIRYFTDNIAINTSANGVAWKDSFTDSKTTSPILLEIFRSSGFLITAAFFGICLVDIRRLFVTRNLTQISNTTRHSDWCRTLVCATTVLTVIAFLPRVLGRVDVDSASRIGCLSLLIIGGLAPLVLFQRFDQMTKGAFVVLAVFLASGIHIKQWAPFGTSAAIWPEVLLVPRAFNIARSEIIDGKTYRLSNVGMAEFNPKHLLRLHQLREFLDSMLTPGASYYDLTNHNADYAYFGRPVPTTWSSVYYQADEHAQIRTTEELVSRKVPLLLLRADNIEGDGGTTALRAYWIYRLVISDYVPFEVGGFFFAVHRNLAKEPRFARYISIQNEEETELFEKAFGVVTDLKSIPLSWGRSFISLESKFASEVQPLIVMPNGADDTILIAEDQSGNPITDYGRFDTLTVFLACKSDNASARITWISDHAGKNINHTMTFVASSGSLVIPVGASPSWLLADYIKELTLSTHERSCDIQRAELRRRLSPIS